MRQEFNTMRDERVQERNSERGGKRCGAGDWMRPILILVAVASLMLAPSGCKPREAEPAGPQKETVAQGGVASATAEPASAAREQKLPRLLDLGAHACIPCKKMKPILDDLMANYADTFETVFIDVWQNQEAGKKYGIQSIPTQIFFDADGNELQRHTGFIAKEDILATWKKHGIDVEKK